MSTPRQLSRREQLPLLLGILGVVALILYIYRPPTDTPPPPAETPGLSKPIEIALSAQPPLSEEDRWQTAMEAYAEGRFGEAAKALERLGDSGHGDPILLLYLGSSYLLIDRVEEAELNLRLALEEPNPRIRAEVRWQLAQSYLVAGHVDAGAEELRRITLGDSHRTPQARSQLEQLRPGTTTSPP